LPRLPTLEKAHYQVPQRFGLTAIIALLTALSVLFGGLNLLHSYFPFPREVYFFAASQVVAVCIAQMVFGSAPRIVSAMAGAALLPAFLAIYLFLNGESMSDAQLAVLIFVCVIFGGLIGYCIGAAAAGFFLATDWLESWFAKKR
jgi:hypothetical protein